MRTELKPRAFCDLQELNSDQADDSLSHKLSRKVRVLFMRTEAGSPKGKAIISVLESNRIKYKSAFVGQKMPDFGRAKFEAVIFEDLRDLQAMSEGDREALMAFCGANGIGFVSFVEARSDQEEEEQVLTLTISTSASLSHLTVNESSSIPRMIKAGAIQDEELIDEEDWTVIKAHSGSFSALAWAKTRSGHRVSVALQSEENGIKRVIMAGDVQHWAVKVLLLDAMHWTSGGKLSLPLSRYVLVDVDDVDLLVDFGR